MNKEKIILLFSDLEGTILNEDNGDYLANDMQAFLSQISELQSLTGANVHMHLVSPVYQSMMERVMNNIDKDISLFNRSRGTDNYISRIEGAAAYPETEMTSEDFLGDRIIPLQEPINSNDFDLAKHGKAHYVRNWCETYKDSMGKDLIMAIYCGNGRNDIDAMSYIKRLKGGFVVCPKNSRTEAKKIASFKSEKTDLLGITEGIAQINEQIRKRVINEVEKER